MHNHLFVNCSNSSDRGYNYCSITSGEILPGDGNGLAESYMRGFKCPVLKRKPKRGI